jgi:hypothetical protein
MTTQANAANADSLRTTKLDMTSSTTQRMPQIEAPSSERITTLEKGVPQQCSNRCKAASTPPTTAAAAATAAATAAADAAADAPACCLKVLPSAIVTSIAAFDRSISPFTA